MRGARSVTGSHRTMGFQVFLFTILLQPAFQESSAQSYAVSGIVRDAETGEPLAAAHVRAVELARGSIANAQGGYSCVLPADTHTLVYSFVGYRPDTFTVNLTGNVEHHVLLIPSSIQMAEVVVTGEDPALAIMRRVIERKHRWREGLATYQFDAFTRQVLYRDTSIASIIETYSTGYMREGDTLREVIRQKRQTENIKGAQNVATVGGLVNFYEDHIRFSGFTFVGPTHPEAFDYYTFRLVRTRASDGMTVFEIAMTPKSKLTPLFLGTLQVVDDHFALAAVEVTPNEAYVIPFLKALKITYAQQFSLYANRYWMPVDIRFRGSVEVGIPGISFPVFGFEGSSVIYDYRLHDEVPDSIRLRPRKSEAAEATSFDSSFWAAREVLPLTEKELFAYATLDSTQTLEEQFRPSGPLSVLTGKGVSMLRYVSLWHNRVQGAVMGGRFSEDSLSGRWKLSGELAYGTADRKGTWSLRVDHALDSSGTFGVSGMVDRGVGLSYDERMYGSFQNSLTSFFLGNDYRDYYYRMGWGLEASAKVVHQGTVRLRFVSERQMSAVRNADVRVFPWGLSLRPNPPADPGRMHALIFHGQYGREGLFGLQQSDLMSAIAEWSHPSMGSNFEFGRVVVQGEYSFGTFLKSLLFPPAMSLRLSAGTGIGILPRQRLFTLESQTSGLGPFGVLRGSRVKEFGGTRFIHVSAEHNFRSSPFLMFDVPWLSGSGIELLVHGSVARAWGHLPDGVTFRTTPGWYVEAGAGVSRVFGLLRLDVGYRWTTPSGFHVTTGISTLF